MADTSFTEEELREMEIEDAENLAMCRLVSDIIFRLKKEDLLTITHKGNVKNYIEFDRVEKILREELLGAGLVR